MNPQHFFEHPTPNEFYFLASTHEPPFWAKRKKVKCGASKKEDFFVKHRVSA